MMRRTVLMVGVVLATVSISGAFGGYVGGVARTINDLVEAPAAQSLTLWLRRSEAAEQQLLKADPGFRRLFASFLTGRSIDGRLHGSHRALRNGDPAEAARIQAEADAADALVKRLVESLTDVE